MRLRLPVFGLLVALSAGLVAPATAQNGLDDGADAGVESGEEPEDGRLITMNFQDIELSALVKFISEITGKNFILDERVKGKITIISPAKISEDEAYAVFQSVLQVKGFATVPSGSGIDVLILLSVNVVPPSSMRSSMSTSLLFLNELPRIV